MSETAAKPLGRSNRKSLGHGFSAQFFEPNQGASSKPKELKKLKLVGGLKPFQILVKWKKDVFPKERGSKKRSTSQKNYLYFPAQRT